MSACHACKLFLRATALSGALFALSGCATLLGGTAYRNDTATLSSDAKILNVPMEKQTAGNLCGLAVTDMLVRYYGQPLSEPQRAALLQTANANDGLSGDALVAALNQAGYYAIVFPGALDHGTGGLYDQIDKGRPVIVMLGTGSADTRHYAVVTGYDPTQQKIVLNDPALGQITLSDKDFDQQWQGANRFTLLAMPQTRHS